ncbi:MAG TPA: hypothetical protein GX395_01675 [Clostridia bacterium]|nr:hypothetical protein [Clostridia bacterium]
MTKGEIAQTKEAYVGEYASGKSEVAINRALWLFETGIRPVILVDLDLVEPFYTLRPLKKELEARGIKVLAWETLNTIGLGETGNLLQPVVRWALRREGAVVIDVGYGVAGIEKLRLLERPAFERESLKIYVVINIARPMTGDVEAVVDYVRALGAVHGLINNSHWGDDTEPAIIHEGAQVVTKAAKILGLPVIWTTVDQKWQKEIGSYDVCGNPVFFLKRYMPRAFW